MFIDAVTINRTLRSYDYTRAAISNMKRIVNVRMWEDMEASVIFHYLVDSARIVSFSTYLKRYLYETERMEGSFEEVPDTAYQKVIKEAFHKRGVPASLSSARLKISQASRKWLSQKTANRSTVFLLGFGLGMKEKTVSEFLVKVLKEEDFNPYDADEVIFRYCYVNGLSYQDALSIRERIHENPLSGRKMFHGGIRTEEELMEHLRYIQEEGIGLGVVPEERISYKVFAGLLEEAKQKAAEILSSGADEYLYTDRKKVLPQEVTNADLEQLLCCGTPVSEHRNFKAAKDSALAEHLSYNRMTRQRLHRVQCGAAPVSRFDLINLSFFIWSQEEMDPKERLMAFTRKTNKILRSCRFMELYPVNAYEAMCMMCLLSEYPLEVYSEVLETSFQ